MTTNKLWGALVTQEDCLIKNLASSPHHHDADEDSPLREKEYGFGYTTCFEFMLQKLEIEDYKNCERKSTIKTKTKYKFFDRLDPVFSQHVLIPRIRVLFAIQCL
jgi:hypothetical protein